MKETATDCRRIIPPTWSLGLSGKRAQKRYGKNADRSAFDGREELFQAYHQQWNSLLILRFASEIMNRTGVIFLPHGRDVVGFGQSGVVLPGGENANDRIRNIRIPLTEESLFKSVSEKRLPYKGRLAESRWNRFLVERLGRGWPGEVYAAPLMNEDRIVAILYCDNLPAQDAIGVTEELEAFIKVAGFAFERALLEEKSQRPE